MKRVIFFILIGSILEARVYENAEDRSTKRWRAFNDRDSVIENIYDREKQSRVIFLKSATMKNGFILKLERDSKAWCRGDSRYLKWDMQTNRDFVVVVSLETKNGHRYLVYTSSNGDGNGYFGLGSDTTDGKWHTFKRDLNLDLKKIELDNEIIGVDTFFIRGREIKVDNIEIIENSSSIESNSTSKVVKEKKRKKRYKPKVCDIYVPKIYNSPESIKNDTTPPKITLIGKKRVYIPVGSEYIEAGATAVDNVDGEVDVEIYGDIDTNRVGTYTLFYKAKDRVGNISIDTRFINVVGRDFLSSQTNKSAISLTPTPKPKVSSNSKEQHILVDSSANSNILDIDLPSDDLEELMAED